MLYRQDEHYREESVRNSRVPEIAFMWSGNLPNAFIKNKERAAEDLKSRYLAVKNDIRDGGTALQWNRS